MRTNLSGYTLVDLFCGAGGLHIGFGNLGFRTLLAVDNNKYCEMFHALNMPDTPFIRKDIRELENDQIHKYAPKHIDVLLGGPPCQGFSTIGSRSSSDPQKRQRKDPRNDLFKEYIRVLNLLRPKMFLFENVKGLLTREKGSVFSAVQNEFEKTGYKFHYVVLNAADYGVPQIRERLFIYGSRIKEHIEPPQPTHGPGRKSYASVGHAISDLAEDSCTLQNHVPLKHGEINIKRYSLIPEGGRLPEKDLPPELYRRNFGNTFKRLHRNRLSLTMVPGHNAFPIHPWLHRSLTVREAARIQTFPDKYVFTGPRHEQCFQVGNAVPIKLAEAWANAFRLSLSRHYAKK